MTSLIQLHPATLFSIQALARSNAEGARLYARAAEAVSSPLLQRSFADLAARRANHAQVLESQLAIHGVDPGDGALGECASEAWASLRAQLRAGNDHAIALEAERGERRIQTAYESLLRQTAGTALGGVLQGQYAQVQATREALRETRDTLWLARFR
ncbi:MAG: PA2169 family four-helix-bundle protein [Planctomycetes bacterium]|nr:PA2169 family four-helix-bundle protein [Planctomycetota bacterium]